MARKTLAEQIAAIGQAKTDYDIENDDLGNGFGESGSDDLGESDDEHARDHYVKVAKSKIREPTSAVRGKKYKGEVVSRESLYKDENDIASDLSQDDSEDMDDEDNEVEDNEDGEDETASLLDAEGSDSGASLRSNSDESEEEQSEAEDEASVDAKRSRIKQILANERRHIVNRLSESATNDALKGYTVLQQQNEFDSLIDLRLKLQKALNISNLLPVDKETLENSDLATKHSKMLLQEATESCFDLLDTIFALRSQLYTKDKVVAEPFTATPSKRSLDKYLESTARYDDVLNKYRGSVLTKWLAKIQNSSASTAMNAGKFKALNQSAEQQVASNLYDMDRLLKRTKLNRRQIKPLGYEYHELKLQEQEEETEKRDDGEDVPEDSQKPARSFNLQEMDLIFDDEDFYRVLLNDLVDKKIQSSDPTSGLQFALKGAASTKLKKNVDNKASKGRKLRYHVQEKIANFDSPRPWLKWNDLQVDEFFASLLGQKISMKEDTSDEEEEEEDVIEADSGIQLFG